MNISPNDIVVLVKVGDKVHQVALSEREKSIVGHTIRQMHNGAVKLAAKPVDGVSITEVKNDE